MTQDSKNKIMFGRGTKSLEEFTSVNGYQNMVYFNTDEYEIYVGGNRYGFSKADQALLKSAIDSISYDETTATFTVSFVDSTKGDVTFSIPTADTKTPGLMTASQVTALGEAAAAVLRLEGWTEKVENGEDIVHKGSVELAEEAAKSYAKDLVDNVLSEDVDAAGAAIVKISQGADGKIVAVSGDVEAAHVSVADAEGNFENDSVEEVLAEIAKKISDLDTSAEGVDGKITAAIEDLDSEIKDESKAHVKVAVSQVDGKLTSVVVTEDNIADKSVVDDLVSSVGSADDVAAADGSVYARIAALVAKDGDLSGRLDALEGEDGAVAEALADAKEYADGLIAGLDANVSSAADQKLTVNVVEVDGKITEVNVTDHDIASAATLAALKEDVDLFFKDASFTSDAKDTLKELQEYITSDVAGAAAMAESIAANKAAIAAEAEDRVNAVKGLSEKMGEPVSATIAQDIADAKQATTDLAEGAVADNTEAIALLNDTVDTVGSVKHTAKGYADAAEEAAKAYADQALYWYEG